ncbi:MAG: ribokinase, partial [Clostridia bacterium]|nr:ribokinase [Clostridia bacterium]
MRIVNYGSLNIDYTFQVEEIVRPGQTIAASKVSRFPGGKGMNQSLALARAGMTIYHAGIIGTDGLFLKEMLEKDGVDCRYLQVREDIGTGSAFIQVDRHGQNCIVLNGGANRMNTEEDCKRVLNDFAPGDWILLQNEINGVDRLIETAWEKNMKVIFNPSPMTNEVLQYNLSKVSLFLMNEDEGMRITGQADA